MSKETQDNGTAAVTSILAKRLLQGNGAEPPASPSRAAAREGPDWGVVNATGTHLEALRAADSAVTAVKGAVQPKDAQDGLRLIEALEAAEAAFDSKHAGTGAGEGVGGARQEGSDTPANDTVATSSGTNAQAAAASTSKPANGVDDVMREKGRRRILAALATNPSFAKRSTSEVQQHASSVEDGCYSTSQQRQTYISKVANAARLAKTETDVQELIRIASGQPRGTG